MMRAHSTHASTRAGFTLLELMVALVAGLIAISSIYYVGAASSRFFHEQQRISQTQMSLRMATEQLRGDIERAGLGGTLNSSVANTCVTPSQPIRAVEFLFNEDTTNLPRAAENGVRADRLRLTGNYSSDGMYMLHTLTAARNGFRFQTERPTFRRDFGRVGTDFSTEAYEEAFAVNRMLRLEYNGRLSFVTITNVDAATQSVSFTPSIPEGCGGLLNNASVTPLDKIEYRVVNPRTISTLENLDELGGGGAAVNDARGRIPSVLIRQRITAGDTPIANTERVVLEWIAEIRYAFTLDDESTTGAPPDLRYFIDNTAESELASAPHHIRAVHYDLSARSADQDPRFGFVARVPGQPLLRYRVTDLIDGAARVRSMSGDVVLRNIGEIVRP